VDIITVETSIKPKETKYLVETWQRYGIVGKILGRGITWNGFGTKLRILKDFINQCQDDIILFTDARDVIFAAGYDEILSTFLSMNTNILFGAETNLYPDKSLIHGNEADKYRYLNSGLFVGYTSSLRKLFNSIDIEHERDDQEALQKKYIEGFPITLDSECKLFQNLWDESGGRNCNFDLLYQPTYIENLRTKTRPKIFHAPGPTTVLTQAYKVAMRLY
jgi:hypothetical protein